jgi:PAS domain S-box-containing protein
MFSSVVKSFIVRLDEFNRNPAGTKFREHGLKGILLITSIVAILIISGINLIDRFAEPYYSIPDPLVGMLFSSVLMLNLILALYFKKYKHFLYSFFYLLAFYFTLSSYLAGEAESPGLIGLNIMLIIWFCLVPLNYRSVIFHGGIFIVQYYLLLYILQLHPLNQINNISAHIFLLFTFFSGSVITILINSNASVIFYEAGEPGKGQEHLIKFSDNMQDILWEMDIQTRKFTYISPSCEKLTGFRPDEVISNTIDTFLTPESMERANKLINEAVNKIVSGKQNIDIPITDFEQYCKDGSTIHTEISATLISNKDKLEIVGVSRNITERKKAEKALKQSEEKFRKIVETSPVAMSFAYTDGRIGYINERFIDKFGYTLTDIPDLDTYFKKVYPDDHYREKVKSEWDNYVEKARSTGTSIDPYEVKMTCKDGSQKDIIILGALLGDSILAIFSDITEIKSTEEALKESQERYSLAVEGVNDGIWDWNLITDEVFFSRRYKAILGYEDNEFANDLDEWKKRIHPEDTERVIKANMDHINGIAPKLEVEYKILHKDGSYRWVLGRGVCLRYENGKAYRMAGSHIDITERKKAEEELRKANERLTFHFMQAPLGYIEWNEKLEVIDWNPAAEKIFGYTKEEAMNCHAFKIIVPPEVHTKVTPVWQSILNQTGGGYNLNENVSKAGKRLVCEWHNTPLKDKEGKVIGIASIVQDITVRKKLEEELAKSHEILQKHYSQTLEKVQIYSEELQIKKNELLKLQKDNLQSQFETLKNQVNPHFLFNSLNVLASLISIDPELAERFTGQLSKIYRYVLEHKSEDIVALSTEMDFLESYVFLLNIRFKDKLKVNIKIAEEKHNMKIPPLAIQLLIENAIKHNIFSIKSPLIIDILVDDNDYLNVINNYQKREKQIESTGLGLQNIIDRIGYFTEKKPYFGVRGDKFVARIPLL